MRSLVIASIAVMVAIGCSGPEDGTPAPAGKPSAPVSKGGGNAPKTHGMDASQVGVTNAGGGADAKSGSKLGKQ